MVREDFKKNKNFTQLVSKSKKKDSLQVWTGCTTLNFGLTAQQEGTTARWFSNKTSLNKNTFLR